MKRARYSRQMSVVVATFVSLALLLASSRATAQKPEPKYKVGDRVEVDIIEATDPARAIWKKGTVTKVELNSMYYAIQLDPLPGQLPKTQTIPIRPYAEAWIHLIGGGAAPNIPTDTRRVDDNGTVLADRELLDCKNLKQARARNGSPLPVELAKKLIRCLYEKPSAPGMDGATTMEISEFRPTASRRWNPREDRGSAATANTIVYPVRVKWTLKTFYRTYNEVLTDREQIFTCFVDGDEWYCGSAQLIKEGEKKQIQVK